MQYMYGKIRSFTLRAVVTDTKELRTVFRNTALPFFFIREQTRMGGF